MSDFDEMREVTARKDHRCCECRLPIRKGTKYVRTFIAWDGRGDSFKSHAECVELYHEVYDHEVDHEENAKMCELREWMVDSDLKERWDEHYEKMKAKYV